MDFTLTIRMNARTLDVLQGLGVRLYALHAMGDGSDGGVPLLWYGTAAYGDVTTVAWSARYQARAADDGGSAVRATVDVWPGQHVVFGDGPPVVTTDGGPCITLANATAGALACGISQGGPDKYAPVCSQPLPAGEGAGFTPVEKVLLALDSSKMEAGTVVERMFSQGVLVDLAGVHQRELTFSIDEAWGWGGAPWATAVPAGTELVPLLLPRVPVPAAVSVLR